MGHSISAICGQPMASNFLFSEEVGEAISGFSFALGTNFSCDFWNVTTSETSFIQGFELGCL